MPLDTLFTAEAPEGIALSLRPAGLVPRALAFGIDFGIRLGLLIVASLATLPFEGVGAGLLMVIFFLIEWFYPVFFELGRRAATPGKRAMGLRVVMDSGLPVTPAASLTRNLLRAADFLPFLYAGAVLSMLLRPDFKRLGDLAAGTLVVYDETVHLHGDVPPAPAAAPGRPLASREQAAVLAWAARAPRLTPERLEELARLAEPAWAPPDAAAPGEQAPGTARLLPVAHWLMGRRGTESRTTGQHSRGHTA